MLGLAINERNNLVDELFPVRVGITYAAATNVADDEALRPRVGVEPLLVGDQLERFVDANIDTHQQEGIRHLLLAWVLTQTMLFPNLIPAVKTFSLEVSMDMAKSHFNPFPCDHVASFGF
jgi:hypothetical protein